MHSYLVGLLHFSWFLMGFGKCLSFLVTISCLDVHDARTYIHDTPRFYDGSNKDNAVFWVCLEEYDKYQRC
jgi:hypothetical protein